MTQNKKIALPSEERENLEEALGMIWHFEEAGSKDFAALLASLKREMGGEIVRQMESHGFVSPRGDRFELTPEGRLQAGNVIRRHRLAERLLLDVLGLQSHAADEEACRLEHILTPEATESICTLLGHPRFCPHGEKIPEGECCRQARTQAEPVVVALSGMEAGEQGKLAYLSLADHAEMHKLLSLGIVPGAAVRVIQTFPSFVIEAGETQIALEETLARCVYLRKDKIGRA